MFQGAGLERVEAGEQVADFAEAVNEGMHARLAQGLIPVAGFGAPPAAGEPQFESLEKEAPVRRELGRVGFPQGELLFDEIPIQRDQCIHRTLATMP